MSRNHLTGELGINKSVSERTVRVFISSTFTDMHEEREYLVKFIFPELIDRCRKREVDFVVIDLRWGITDEQTAEGKVLPICLEEINRCNYFIGLLGERYGWVPKHIDSELVEVQPWLEEHKDRSITELEILHGVINNPKMAENAFFYFRDSAYLEQITEDRLSDYLSENSMLRARLEAVKARIRESNLKVRENYPNPEAVGKLILENLWESIDKAFPEGSEPTPLEREAAEHQAFASSRVNAYIGREEYFDRLDGHVNSDAPPLVVVGDAGIGKSAMLANWALRYQETHPEDFVLIHFIGSNPKSADYVEILRRIIGEIKHRYQSERHVPVTPEKLHEEFPHWLAVANSGGRFIIILDGLNQLEDWDNAPDLGWLPEYFPANIRVILSTLPGRSLAATRKRDWSTFKAEGLNVKERQQLVKKYLGQYGKRLGQIRVRRIATAAETANPLYLRTLLEELRIFGAHEELDNRIEHYLEAPAIPDLYEKVLCRLEQDYEKNQPGLVRKAMSFLWAARFGLNETELLELLGSMGKPLPRALWSPFYLAVQNSLVSRSGLLGFCHDYMHQAVRRRYLHSPQTEKTTHLRLAEYFSRKEFDERKVDELPWQLLKAEKWERLKNCISSHRVFSSLIVEAKKFELIGYWQAIGDRFDVVDVYLDAYEQYEHSQPSQKDLSELIYQMAMLFVLMGLYGDAELFLRHVLEMKEKIFGKNHACLSKTLNSLALTCLYQSKYSEAEDLLKHALEIIKKDVGEEHLDVVVPLRDLAQLCLEKGLYDTAELLMKRVIEIQEKAHGRDHIDLAASLVNLADTYARMMGLGLYSDYVKGAASDPHSIYGRARKMVENKFGCYHPDVALIMNKIAWLYGEKRNYRKAEELYRQALEILETVLGLEHSFVGTSLNNLAQLCVAEKKYTKAEPLFKRALEIKEKAFGENHLDVVAILENMASLYKKMGKRIEAKNLKYRAFDIRSKIKKSLGPSLPLHWELRTVPEMQSSLKAYRNFTGILSDSPVGKILQPLGNIRPKLRLFVETVIVALMVIPFVMLSGMSFKVHSLFKFNSDLVRRWSELVLFGFGHIVFSFVFFIFWGITAKFIRELFLPKNELFAAVLGGICAFFGYAILFVWLRSHNVLVPSTVGNGGMIFTGILGILIFRWLLRYSKK